MPREQPHAEVTFDSDAPSVKNAPRDNNPTPVVSESDTDWTIDIRPGPATEISPTVSQTPDLASTVHGAIAADEELRGGGDEATSLAVSPISSGFSSSPHRPVSSSRNTRLLTAAGALICLHLMVAALRLLALAWREQRRLAATAAGDEGPARITLDQILTSRRIRRPVQLLYARNVRGPAACGWRRWKIVLPAGLDHEMPRDELRALLAHELAHLVRRDTLWLWWSHLLCMVLPLQPLNFLARRRWEEAAEYLCDAWAVEADVGPLTMAKCLTRVAGRYLGKPAPVGLTAVGRQTTLSRRIERLTAGRVSNPSHGRAGRLLVVFLSITAAAAAVIAAPQVSLEGEPVQPVESASEASPSGNQRDEELRSTGDEGPEEEIIPLSAVDAQSELRNELQTLLADLDRLNELLAGMEDSPEFIAAREQIQQRLRRIRGRLAEDSEPLEKVTRTLGASGSLLNQFPTSELDSELSP